MSFLICLFLGFITAVSGSIVPSFLNLTVIKVSLKNGTRSAIFLIAGFATVLFFQANIGAYLAGILMENKEYIVILQKIGTAILLILSIHYFRLHFFKKRDISKKEIKKSKAYFQGIGMSLLNAMAIPFYFTSISLWLGFEYFTYSYANSFYFSIGSTVGSFSLYSLYAIIASKIEARLNYIATKMNLILALLTGVVGLFNLIYLFVI